MAIKIGKEELVRLYEIEKLNDKEIGVLFNFSHRYIGYLRKQYNIKTMSRSERNPLNQQLLTYLYEHEKLTDAEIGEQYGYCESHIGYLRDKYGIKTNKSFQKHRKIDVVKIYNEYVEEGLYQQEIADRYGVSKDWLVIKWSEMGLKIRKNRRHGKFKSLLTNESAMEILTGTLLGDAYLGKTGKGYRIELKHAVSQQEWLAWKAKRLSSAFDFSFDYITDTRGFKGLPQVRAVSRLHPELDDVYFEWYEDDGKKYISLSSMLTITPLALAVWIMDDGTLNKKRYTIYSQSFTRDENDYLCEYLNDTFGLHARTRKHRDNEWVISFMAKDFNYISGYLEKYFAKDVPSMAYKWNKNSSPVLHM